jgi:hypothetical protein
MWSGEARGERTEGGGRGNLGLRKSGTEEGGQTTDDRDRRPDKWNVEGIEGATAGGGRANWNARDQEAIPADGEANR